MQEEIILLIVGGLIGFFSSVGMYIVEHIVDRKGKIKIYYKFINFQTDHEPWGLREVDQEFALIIPATIEIQNTSNSTRVIRDVCAELYKGKTFVAKMKQIECSLNQHASGGKVETEITAVFGADNGSYSFMLQPRSIQNQKLEFILRKPHNQEECESFDRVVISYYDERDKKHSYIAKDGLVGWKMEKVHSDDEWILLKKRL